MRITSLGQARSAVQQLGLDVTAAELIAVEALGEDLGQRGVLPAGDWAGVDVTSMATIPAGAQAHGQLIARAPGTLAGGPIAALVLALSCDQAGEFTIDIAVPDGTAVTRGDVLMTAYGNTRALLTAERVALNLVTMMSGVATSTHAWVAALRDSTTQVRDSRKTTPGLRMLQKYAVRVAGGVNHRMSLADAALIKDNHVIAAGGVVPAFQAVRAAFPDTPVQVEVTTAQQARDVVSAGATDILLDNMTPVTMTRIVSELKGRCVCEASGGLTIRDARAIAQTGVDYVAVGAITHSAPILDIAFDLASDPA